MAVEIDDNTLRQLIPLVIDDPQQPRVNARHLHEFLRVGKVFGTWITDRIGQYDLVKGQTTGFASQNREAKNAEWIQPPTDAAKDYLKVLASAIGKTISDLVITNMGGMPDVKAPGFTLGWSSTSPGGALPPSPYGSTAATTTG